jgi:apolipoprotein N-acyltransferase
MDFPQLILKRWPARLICFVLGAIGALGFAPVFIIPALIISLSGLWIILSNQSVIAQDPPASQKRVNDGFINVFWLGWWFGLGHFTGGLYWIANALTVDLAAFWWLIPFALFGIPSVLAIFIGLTCLLTALWPFNGISRALVFAGIWLIFEWLRGIVFTGFPWNLLGYAWAVSPEMLQSASLFGVYGLSLLTLLFSISLGYIVGEKPYYKIFPVLITLTMGGLWLFGKDRIQSLGGGKPHSFAVRIVQPSIPQTLKWDAKEQEYNFNLLLTMTKQPSLFQLNAVIWPESAVSFVLEKETYRRELIGESLPKGGLLFTGALRRSEGGPESRKIWNSLLVLNDQGDIISHYDKAHLVPFGEYIPFRSTLDSIFGKGTIKKITVGAIDFSCGTGPETIDLKNGFPTFSALVCYEVIFPRSIVNPDGPRPDWLINITNDAWFGNLSGPYQHLEMARFRAVEEGLPLVRAANNGISVVIDALGRTQGKIELNQRAVLDLWLPVRTTQAPLYARYGDWITLWLILGTIGIALLLGLNRRFS